MPTKRTAPSKNGVRRVRRSKKTPPPNALSNLREGRGMTLLDMHRACGASQSAVFRWEHGQCEPPKRFRAKYAEALGIESVGALGKLIYELI